VPNLALAAAAVAALLVSTRARTPSTCCTRLLSEALRRCRCGSRAAVSLAAAEGAAAAAAPDAPLALDAGSGVRRCKQEQAASQAEQAWRRRGVCVSATRGRVSRAVQEASRPAPAPHPAADAGLPVCLTLGSRVPCSARSSSQDESDEPPDARGEGVTTGAWYWLTGGTDRGLQAAGQAGRGA
jgi:hypothetical protein